jgi:hypothetical protein
VIKKSQQMFISRDRGSTKLNMHNSPELRHPGYLEGRLDMIHGFCLVASTVRAIELKLQLQRFGLKYLIK